MSETKDEIAAERDTLRAENDRLAAQNLELQRRVDAQGRPGVATPRHTFTLTEGGRLELEQTGITTINGVIMTRAEVEERLRAEGENPRLLEQLGDREPSTENAAAVELAARRARTAIPGVDFVYPSVAPGQIDPTVAGTPGINGPAADPVPAEPTRLEA